MTRKLKTAALALLALLACSIAVAHTDGIYNPSANNIGGFEGIDSNTASGVVVTPVALDAGGTPLQFTGVTGATGTTYTGETIGAALSHSALVCAFQIDNTADVTPTLVWDSGGTNQSMTQITLLANATSTGEVIYLYGLVAPTAGNKTLKVTWVTGGSLSGYVNCISWKNVNQTGGVTTFNNPQTIFSGGATPVALTTTGTANDASVTGLACFPNIHRTATTATSWTALSSGPLGNFYGDQRLGVGAISDTLDGALNCLMAAVTIKAG